MNDQKVFSGQTLDLVVQVAFAPDRRLGIESQSDQAVSEVVCERSSEVNADHQDTTGAADEPGRTVETQANGGYLVPLLLPGAYSIEVSKAGFKTASRSRLEINVTETARLDAQLEVGEISSTVDITAGAELLQTDSSALGRVTDRALVSNLPLVTRNYTQIVSLSAGIAANVTNATELGRGSGGLSQGSFRAHGASGCDNNFQMNGIQINDLQASGSFSGGVAPPAPTPASFSTIRF